MKKITLLLTFLLFAANINAQNMLFFSDSEDITTFTVIDEDGDGSEWFDFTFTELGIDPAYPGFSSGKIISSDSAFSPDTTNNSLITPSITVPSDATVINFSMIVSASDYDTGLEENYAIYVFDANVVTAFGGTAAEYDDAKVTEIFKETLDADDVATGSIRTVSIPVSFAGKDIKISIRHFNTVDQGAIFVDDITVTSDGTLSVKDNELNITKTYPSPVKNLMTVTTDFSIEKATIYNQLGQQIEIIGSDDIVKNTLDLSKLNTGIYFVILEAGNNSSTLKIIKK